MKKESNKDFIWLGVRIGFWLMIFFYFALIFFTSDFENSFELFLIFLTFVSTIFVFILSIIHLNKKKKKSFAIVSLVFSSIFLFFFLIGFIIGLTEVTGETEIYNQNFSIQSNYIVTKGFEVYAGSYFDFVFESKIPLDLFIFESNEFNHYEKGESSYYLEGGENLTSFRLDDVYFREGDYIIYIGSYEKGGEYFLQLISDNY